MTLNIKTTSFYINRPFTIISFYQHNAMEIYSAWHISFITIRCGSNTYKLILKWSMSKTENDNSINLGSVTKNYNN